ncbi:hypothetical protein MNBD_BACTEROID01-1476 [hydrothermal vent metagenome]|uniref:Uncharacterized protein n=1 Tax=hydrothermal vent metagenome TaxID=652676 RepID=A0A3B0U062_9ZZZZ
MADDKKSINEGLKSLAAKVATFIDDLASLEVTTYSGDFSLTIADIKEGNDDTFKIKSLLKAKPVTLNSKLNLVAFSRFEIDADSSNIVRNNLTADDKFLLEAHNEMVKAGMEARKAMFEFAKALIVHNK